MAIYTNPSVQTLHSGSVLATPAGSRIPGAAANVQPGSRREAVLNTIAYFDVLSVPIMDMLPKLDFDNVVWEWPVDYFEDARTRNSNGAASTNAHIRAYIEDAAIDPALPSRTRDVLANYSHTQWEEFSVSDLQRAMNEIAVADEYTHQGWKKFFDLARSFEYALLWSSAALPTLGAAARKMHGLFPWGLDCGSMTADSDTKVIAGHVVPGAYRGIHYTGTGNDITDDEFYDQILMKWVDRGANLNQAICICGWAVKRLLSGFAFAYQGSGPTLTAAPRNERTISAAARTIVDTIDIFETDLGPIYVAKHQMMSGSETRSLGITPTGGVKPAASMILFEPDYFRIGVLQGFYLKRLATDRLSSTAAVAGTLSLACLNPKAIATAHNIAA